jgi:predicted PurR-regulated permease PerM
LTLALLTASGAGAYGLADNAMDVLNELPETATKVRRAVEASRANGDGLLGRLQRASAAITKAAEPPSPGRAVTRVQVEAPPMRAADYVAWGEALIDFLARLAAILLLAFFLLASGDLYRRKLVKIVGPSLTKKRVTVEILHEVNAQIGKFLLVQAFVAVLVGVTTWLALLFMGVGRAAAWGVVAGVFSTVPYFGPLLVAAGLGVVAFIQFDSLTMAVYASIAAGCILAINAIKGFVVAPWLVGRAASMNQVAVLVGLLFWTWLWGMPGMLLAMPLMTTIKAICDRVEGLRPIGEMLGD